MLMENMIDKVIKVEEYDGLTQSEVAKLYKNTDKVPLVYKGRGHMNDPSSYAHPYVRIDYECKKTAF